MSTSAETEVIMPQAPGHVMEQKGKVAEAGHLQARAPSASGKPSVPSNIRLEGNITPSLLILQRGAASSPF